MNSPQIISDIEFKVKEALQIWAEWMQQDNSKELGYGNCAGFSSDSKSTGWEDFERAVNKNMAINVQAVYEGLPNQQQVALDHFHLAAVWRSTRNSLDVDYANALIGLQVGLRRRGLV